MQLLPWLAASLALAPSVTASFANDAARGYTDEDICRGKHESIVDAIHRFCSKKDIVVHSQYASAGVESEGGIYKVKIKGDCPSDSKWVPQRYCYSQFYSMCANAGRWGQSKAEYGKNKCQKWEIQLQGMPCDGFGCGPLSRVRRSERQSS